jgi:hypothetical protein
VKKQILLLGVMVAVGMAGIISYNLFKTPEVASTAVEAPTLILCWAATSFLTAIFTLRSLHVAIRACRQSSAGQPPRLGDQDILLPEQWFVHCAAAMQFLVIGYLSL